MKTVLMTALFAAPLMLAGPAGAAELVVNGGFEEPVFVGWVSSHVGLVGPQEAGDAHSGDGALLFGADPMILDGYPQTFDVLSQDLATVVGQTYTLSYWLAVSNLPSLPPVSLFRVSIGDFEAPPHAGSASADYAQYSFDYVAQDAGTELVFSGYSKFGYYKLDDVSVIAKATGPVNEIPGVTINPMAVPEPATWALAIVGMGAVGTALRSRRKLAPSLA